MRCGENRGSGRRDWFAKNYNVTTFEEAMRVGAPGTENGAFVGMVIGYWEQPCALLNCALLHGSVL